MERERNQYVEAVFTFVAGAAALSMLLIIVFSAL
jgi:hypothetical protein